jgi:beta-galactosidase
VHVFTTGDEVELVLNGRSLGRKKKGPLEYRLRWDDVVYEPGVLEAVAYRNGSLWARTEVRTAEAPVTVKLEPDRKVIVADGKDLCFVTVRVVDRNGITVPRAANRLEFDLQGPGVIVATDNGDPTSYESFKLRERAAFNGLCLVIVRGLKNQPGTLILRVRSNGLEPAQVKIRTVAPTSHSR